MSTVTARPCWEPQSVAYALPIDAGAMPEALFRFVHVPGVITRLRFVHYGSRADAGDPCTEEQVLNDLLKGEASMRVAAVVGESGTGKSHLVRWLYIELKRAQAHDEELRRRFHVVYVPKTKTTLKGIVDRILEGQTGPRFEEFAGRLKKAHDSFNPQTARERLVDELANSIRDLKAANPGDGRGDESGAAYRKVLLDQLPTLLQNDVYRRALVQDGGVIQRTIDRALERVSAEESLPRFTAADLHLDLAEFADMSAAGRKLFQKLRNDKYKNAALDLLNEVLDPAVGLLFDVRRGEIGELLNDVRAELQARQRELVLLIEDLALLQGVEHELLEAIIAPIQEVEGRRLCPVRAAFAVTTGHFQDKNMSTVWTRLDADDGARYSLDGGNEGSNAKLADALELVGSYLNAARWGKTEIEAWAQANPDVTGKDAVNRCRDCMFSSACLTGFGRSPVAGYGLYPFNAMAISRILTGETFEPRRLLSHIRETLRDERDAIANGTFPTKRWADRYDPTLLTTVSYKVRGELTAKHTDPRTAERAERLIQFWAGEVDTAVNLPDEIHKAFSVPKLAGAPTLQPVVPVDETLPDQPVHVPARRTAPARAPASRTLSGIEQDIQTINLWHSAIRKDRSQQAELTPAFAREVRLDLAEFLLQRVPASVDFLSIGGVKHRASELANGIYIQAAAGGNPRSEEATVLTLDQSHEALLIALRKARRNVAMDHRDLDALLDASDAFLDDAHLWLLSALGDGTEQDAACRLAYFGALLAGQFSSETSTIDTDAETIATMFAPRTGNPPAQLHHKHTAIEIVSQSWTQATKVLDRTMTVRQNPYEGGPVAADAAALLERIERFRNDNLKPASGRTRAGIPQALAAAADAIEDVIREGQEIIARLATALGEIEPDAQSRAVSSALAAFVDAAAYASIPIGDLTELRNQAQDIATVDLDALRGVATEAGLSRNRDQALRFQSRIPWRDALTVLAFVQTANATLAGSAGAATRSSASSGGDLRHDLQEAVVNCREALSALRAGWEEVATHAG